MSYGRKGRGEYWEEIKHILSNIPKNDLVIWAADNNGQIAIEKGENAQEGVPTNNPCIGPWHYAQKSERGKGTKLTKIIYKRELTATNTIHIPKHRDRNNLITWASGDKTINKQLDYIMISKNMRTWLNYTKVKGTANTNHENQHNIARMEIRTKLKAKEQRQTLTKHIKFNINQLRENTELLIINIDNEERKQVEKMATNLTRTNATTKRERITKYGRNYANFSIRNKYITSLKVPKRKRKKKGERKKIAREKRNLYYKKLKPVAN